MQRDPQFEDVYRRFDRGHDRLREDLLAKLQTAPAATCPLPRDPVAIRWHVQRWAAGLAATVLIGAAVWAIFFRPPTAAYGIDDVPDRLAACRSVFLDGWLAVDGVRYPRRLYVEPGKRYWTTTLAGADNRVFTGYAVSDSKNYVTASEHDHIATFGREDPLVFELAAGRLTQIGIADQLLGADRRGFINIGRSTLNGATVDMYSRTGPFTRGRQVVWLNPATGIPLRLATFRHAQDGVEKQTSELNVTTNAPPPPDMPSATPPAGYTPVRHDREPREALQGGGASVNGEAFSVLLALNLEDRAVLLCWSHFDLWNAPPEAGLGGAVGARQALDFRALDGKRKYVALHLHDDPWTGGHHARWSLLVPEDGGAVGPAELAIDNDNGRMQIPLSPLRLNRGDLARIAVETQKLTLPHGAAALDLDALEKLIRVPAPATRPSK